MWRPTISSDEIWHHGIQGMHWGQRNGPPYPLSSSQKSSSEKQYANENMKTADKQNLDKWGKSRDNNILYIRGISGSGKSTVANAYKDANTDVIHLDLYTEKQNQNSKDRNKAFDDYLKKKKFDLNGITTDEKDMKTRFKNMDQFAEHMINFSKKQYDKKRKVIAEGVQLNDDTIFADKKFFDDKPVITLKTNKAIADKRANERDAIRDIKDYSESITLKAKDHEPAITKDFRSAVRSSTAKVYGLHNRLKTQESISRKLEKNAKEEGMQKAASNIKDAVRYTAISNDNDFVNNYESIKRDLEKKGYEETRCKNYWDQYRQGKVKHKSVQCNFKDPYGYEFEIQFHTPSSQNAKTKKIPLYEEARDTKTSPARRAQLETQMVKLAETVSDPKDVYKIKSH